MRAPLARQACEPCRRRKVRCDADRPTCGSCSALKVLCEYNPQRRKRGPKPRPSSTARTTNDTSHATSSLDCSGPIHLGVAGCPPAECSADSQSLISSPDESSQFQRSTQVTSPPAPCNQAQQVHRTLTATIESLSRSVDSIARNCVDICMLSLFPTCPIFYPPALRRSTILLQPSSLHLFEAVPNSNPASVDSVPTWYVLRTFAQLTAIFACALCRTRQTSEAGNTEPLITAFLAASRGMMACCEDWDVAYPDSSSLVIRLCQSAAFHHLGKTRASWLSMGQALCLAVEMRLYEETATQNLDPLEARLRKNLFMILCTSDMSASVLNNRPLSFHEIYIDDGYLRPSESEDGVSLLAGEGHLFEPPYEEQLLEGFYLCQRMWKMATCILLDMKMLARKLDPSAMDSCFQNTGQQSIMESYVLFCGILDSLPPWLRNPGSHVAGDEAATAFQRRTFWHQRVDIVVTFHCLRLALLQQASRQGLYALLGLTSNLDMLALRKIEIASDLTSAVTTMPFEALQAHSEPLVEKIRQVGVSLLEIAHQNENESISSRARLLLSTIIEVIARLDSRVSDELSSQQILPL